MSFIRVSLIWLIFYECNGDDNGSVSSINSADLASNINDTAILGRQAGYGLITFDSEVNHKTEKYGFVKFDGDSHRKPLKFEETGPSYTPRPIQDQLASNPGGLQNGVSLQDGSTQNNNAGQKKRRKRRRRKFRRSQLPASWVPPGPQGDFSEPPFERPPLPASPLRTISVAFSSIVENDTKRCVSRMLCEQAATGELDKSSSILQSVVTLMQYLPLLQQSIPYSTLPLFKAVYVVSQAIKVGLTGNANNESCLNEYPECPSDPEERIHYLNNHNGGLFRFFGGNSQHEYTPEEFHNSLQQIGLHHSFPHQMKTMPNFSDKENKANNKNNPNLNQNEIQQMYSSGQYGQYGLQNNYPNTGYGLQKPNYQSFRPNANVLQYGTKNSVQGVNTGFVNNEYGSAYPQYRRLNNNEEDQAKNENNENEIQRRIQNKPDSFGDNTLDDKTVRWSFPKIESPTMHFGKDSSKIRNGRQLKFPDTGTLPEQVNVKQPKGVSFPGALSNRQYLQVFGSNDDAKYEIDGTVDNIDYDVQGEYSNGNIDDGVEIVYVLRGNGDPNRPEIIKLRPGEKIH